MVHFLTRLILDLFVAFGVVIGASMLGGIAAVLTLQPPAITMIRIADSIKLWALVTAVGGSIDPFKVIEGTFVEGEFSPAIKQILYILGAFVGAHFGTKLIHWICNGGNPS